MFTHDDDSVARPTACNCENSHCKNCRGDATCAFPASQFVTCDYIGGICDACATFMPHHYLRGDVAGWLAHVYEGAESTVTS